MCVLVAVCERDGMGLSDLKKGGDFSRCHVFIMPKLQPCRKDNLAKYPCLYCIGGSVYKCDNADVPEMDKLH